MHLGRMESLLFLKSRTKVRISTEKHELRLLNRLHLPAKVIQLYHISFVSTCCVETTNRWFWFSSAIHITQWRT